MDLYADLPAASQASNSAASAWSAATSASSTANTAASAPVGANDAASEGAEGGSAASSSSSSWGAARLMAPVMVRKRPPPPPPPGKYYFNLLKPSVSSYFLHAIEIVVSMLSTGKTVRPASSTTTKRPSNFSSEPPQDQKVCSSVVFHVKRGFPPHVISSSAQRKPCPRLSPRARTGQGP